MASKCFSVFITGCNRPNGIGFNFVQQILDNWKPVHLFATCRSRSKAKELEELAAQNKNLHIVEMDVTDESKYAGVVSLVDKVTEGKGVNVLINNSGIFTHPQNSISDFDGSVLLDHFRVNCIAPIMLTKAFIPLLEKASNSESPGIPKPVVVNMTTKMASISDSSGGCYMYRSSKVALNMATKSLGLELKPKGIVTILMHPGWVRTDMGGPNGLLSTDQSVAGILKVVENATEEHIGQFLQYDGKEIPW